MVEAFILGWKHDHFFLQKHCQLQLAANIISLICLASTKAFSSICFYSFHIQPKQKQCCQNVGPVFDRIAQNLRKCSLVLSESTGWGPTTSHVKGRSNEKDTYDTDTGNECPVNRFWQQQSSSLTIDAIQEVSLVSISHNFNYTLSFNFTVKRPWLLRFFFFLTEYVLKNNQYCICHNLVMSNGELYVPKSMCKLL